MKQKLMNMNPVVISAALTGGGADTVAGKALPKKLICLFAEF